MEEPTLRVALVRKVPWPKPGQYSEPKKAKSRMGIIVNERFDLDTARRNAFLVRHRIP
jgi:hypothetical protein